MRFFVITSRSYGENRTTKYFAGIDDDSRLFGELLIKTQLTAAAVVARESLPSAKLNKTMLHFRCISTST